jgi:hypothetical protein
MSEEEREALVAEALERARRTVAQRSGGAQSTEVDQVTE